MAIQTEINDRLLENVVNRTYSNQEISGTVVNAFSSYIQKVHTPGVYRMITRRVSQDQYNMFREKLKPTAWISMHDFSDVLESALHVLWQDDAQRAEDLGYGEASFTLSKVERWKAKFSGAGSIFKNLPASFKQQYNPGTLRVEHLRDGEVRLSVKGLSYINDILCARFAGLFRGYAELSGGSNARATYQREGEQNLNVVFTVSWD